MCRGKSTEDEKRAIMRQAANAPSRIGVEAFGHGPVLSGDTQGNVNNSAFVA